LRQDGKDLADASGWYALRDAYGLSNCQPADRMLWDDPSIPQSIETESREPYHVAPFQGLMEPDRP